ncbi:MAG TPA: peptidase S10 [Vicinamibacteria bacterium]|nr:peptidase S10 [Vicinamibacteria bacterium]
MLSPIPLVVLLLSPNPQQPSLPATVAPERAVQRTGEAAPASGDKKEPPEEAPVVTRHEVRLGSKVLKYTVTTGLLPLKNEVGETEAQVFFMAYVAERPGPPAERPLMFSFNGGPGSSSVWLHLGALGPKRVRMLEEGGLPPPPYQLVDNPHTWLERTDLVFIDPVGTGFSRPAKPELGKKFWGLEGDIQSVGEFIRLYLTRYQRWASPLFLVGESYGTTRAAGLAGHLVEKGIALNGIVLVSSILNFQTARFTKGNDLPFVLYLPTYTATAWHHKKLPADLQAQPLRAVLDQAERWASGPYSQALAQGDGLSAEERQTVVQALARYTGLDTRYVDLAELRVEIQRFCKELLRDHKRTVGRLDSRFQGMDLLAITERPEFDPSMAAIRPPYTAMFNDYVRGSLGYKSDLTYHILGGGIGPWDWGSGNGFADTSDALRSAFAKNPYMKLYVASGYYDLATPYFATQYTLAHLGLDASLKGNITTGLYEAGHMMYIHERELARLKQDVAGFLEAALPGK